MQAFVRLCPLMIAGAVDDGAGGNDGAAAAAPLLQRTAAATILQSAYRGYRARAEYATTRASIITAQAIVRGYVARKQFAAMVEAKAAADVLAQQDNAKAAADAQAAEEAAAAEAAVAEEEKREQAEAEAAEAAAAAAGDCAILVSGGGGSADLPTPTSDAVRYLCNKKTEYLVQLQQYLVDGGFKGAEAACDEFCGLKNRVLRAEERLLQQRQRSVLVWLVGINDDEVEYTTTCADLFGSAGVTCDDFTISTKTATARTTVTLSRCSCSRSARLCCCHVHHDQCELNHDVCLLYDNPGTSTATTASTTTTCELDHYNHSVDDYHNSN